MRKAPGSPQLPMPGQDPAASRAKTSVPVRRPDPPEPFYARTMGRRREREAIVRLVNRIGTHLICGRKTCRRARTCTDADLRDLPRCFWQHRGMVRMVAMAAMERLGLKDVMPPDEGPNPPPLPPMGHDEPTVLGRMRADGAPIHLLQKPVDADEDPWCHEYHEDAVKLFRCLVGRERS